MKPEDERYRRIVGAVPEGIWVVNPQGGTIFCNERMARLLRGRSLCAGRTCWPCSKPREQG